MNRLTLLACAFAALLAAALTARAQEKGDVFDAELPPRVVKTEPPDRAKDVDYRLQEIKVTFDRPMIAEKSWSWMMLVEIGVFPGYKTSPGPRWEDDGRTCVLPVKLSPDTLYAVGANSPRNTGFRGRDGKVAIPFAWVFKTKR